MATYQLKLSSAENFQTFGFNVGNQHFNCAKKRKILLRVQ